MANYPALQAIYWDTDGNCVEWHKSFDVCWGPRRLIRRSDRPETPTCTHGSTLAVPCGDCELVIGALIRARIAI